MGGFYEGLGFWHLGLRLKGLICRVLREKERNGGGGEEAGWKKKEQ